MKFSVALFAIALSFSLISANASASEVSDSGLKEEKVVTQEKTLIENARTMIVLVKEINADKELQNSEEATAKVINSIETFLLSYIEHGVLQGEVTREEGDSFSEYVLSIDVEPKMALVNSALSQDFFKELVQELLAE